METSDITIFALREIRDEMKGMRAEQQQTNVKLDAVEHRLEGVENRLGTLETRVADEIVGLRSDFVVVRDLLAGRRDLGQRVERCEADIADLKRRVP